MLFLRSASYDPSTQTLTVRMAAPSRTSWTTYEYRDVSPELYRALRAAQPHAQHVLDEQIAPCHEVRLAGQQTWRAPERPRTKTRGLIVDR